jgi:hypothetical protein
VRWAILELAAVTTENQAVRCVASSARGLQVLPANVSAGTGVIHVGTGVDVGHTELSRCAWSLRKRLWGQCVGSEPPVSDLPKLKSVVAGSPGSDLDC